MLCRVMPVHNSLISWYLMNTSNYDFNDIVEISRKYGNREITRIYLDNTYDLPVCISPGLMLPVFIPENNISMADILYECGELIITGILKFLMSSRVLSLW